MFIFGILLFSICAFLMSFLPAVSADLDKGKMSLYVILTAWGSMIYGLCVARVSP